MQNPLRRSLAASPPLRPDGVVLLLQIPRTNEKKELAAEQMFASLHGLLSSEKKMFQAALRDTLSFEIAVQNKRICFYVWVPEHLKAFVEEQIYAQYPEVNISEVVDYAVPSSDYTSQLSAELRFTADDALPLRTFPSFEVDPLAAITAGLAQFEGNEEAWLQVLIRPAKDNWYKSSEKYVAKKRGGSTNLLKILSTSPTAAAPPKLTEFDTARASAAEEKSHKLAYETKIRIIYRGHGTEAQARMRIQAIGASFKQFNGTYLNGFVLKYLGTGNHFIHQYHARAFESKGLICNIEELASLYHLPHTNVETPNILWASAKTAEPPANLPLVTEATRDLVSPIAVTNFRGHNTMFGMPRVDRGRHLYIIGQTGVGKSALLELLTISEIDHPYGFAVIDPHGDYALNILRRIPEDRIKDVIYFNPADTDFPIAFNPMEVYDEKLKTHTTSELIGVLKRMFESWGPRLEYILRYSLLALLDYPQATMLDITRILTDKKFRNEVLSYVQDPVVKNFWTVEFASWNDKFAAEAVAPVLNKVGAFTANPTVRNIIGQPKSSFNIRKIMDERKILIVNLSRGLIGEDNAALLGALLVTKIQLAAMSRADIGIEERHPFYLYVDEFQNFATESFATILSEARKYGLNLTVANQYIAQMDMTVKDAVFGNVGSIIGFRMSADDSRTMMKYFEPNFLEYDLVHMHNRHFAISMTIEGEKAQAFSATTLDLPPAPTDYSPQIIEHTRRTYAVNRADIESFVQERYVGTPKLEPVRPTRPRAPRPDDANRGAPTTPATPTEAPSQPSKSTPSAALPAKPQTPSQFVIEISNRLNKVIPETPASITPGHPSGNGSEEPKPKRKRTRRRKKKTSDHPIEQTSPINSHYPTPSADVSGDLSDEHVIRFR
ncbi:MAG: hypothetical protein JWS12_613 [Candidatus Saccharibacteria bacterium]|nr:hypothetical protein [Candidatus Saccharibacteria bacterium]